VTEASAARAEDPSLDLVVVGHTNVDHFLHVPELPRRDRTVPVSFQEQRLGGTAANIARVAAGYGVNVALVSRVGGDFPDRFRKTLEVEHVDLAGLEVVADAFTPCAYIVEDGHGGQVTLMDQGPMGDERDAAVPIALLRRARWVHLTTGDPKFQLRVGRAARAAGARVAADPAQEIHYRWTRSTLEELLSISEIFFANRGELAHALRLLRLKRPEALLTLVPVVVVTRGSGGALAFTRRGRLSEPASGAGRPGRVIGAGDAFRGAFYAGWFAGEPLKRCLRAGTRGAARWLRSGGEPPRGSTAPSTSRAGKWVRSPKGAALP
jgi:sugar/nucleoside kinase (ribokinase family)